jgi:hypothetical protein
LVDDRCWNCDPEIAVLTHKHAQKT